MVIMIMHLNHSRAISRCFANVMCVLLLTSVTGCKNEPEAPVQAENTPHSSLHTFRMSSVDPVSLDPAKGMGAAAQQVLLNTFEGLYIARHGDGKVRLGVAASEPEVSDDGLTWTFGINPENRWSDGKAIDADDFVRAWRRVVHPDTASPMAEDLHILKNGEAIAKGELPNEQLGVKKLNNGALRVFLAHPVPNFRQRLSRVAFLPSRLGPGTKTVPETFSGERWVSNGPYMLDSWKLRDSLHLKVNPHHPLAASLHFRKIELIHTEDSQMGLRLFRSGKLDVAAPIPANAVQRLLQSKDESLRIDSTLCSTALMFNLAHPAVESLNIRAALSHAVDRKALVHHILRRGDQVAAGYFPRGLQQLTQYKGATGREFNPQKARALYEQARAGKTTPLSIPLLYNSHDTNQQIAEAIQASVQKHLGLKLILENVEWKTFLDRVNKGDFAIARSALCGMSEPMDWAEIFLTGGGVNWAGFSDEKYDQRLSNARKSTDRSQQLAAAQMAEKQVLDQAVVIPLFYQVNAYMLSSSIAGYLPHPENIHLFRDLRRE